MNKYELANGDIVEITASDSYSGPDGKPGCQRVGFAIWIRVNGGEWVRSPHKHMYQQIKELEDKHATSTILGRR